MAWTDQCKVAFCYSADHLIQRNGGKGITKTLRQISKESDIPFKTLEKWWYSNSPKNEGNPESSQDSVTSDQSLASPSSPSRPLCSVCKQYPCKKERVVNGVQKYKPRCNRCYKKMHKTEPHRKPFFVLCPHCGEEIYLTKSDLKKREDVSHES